MSKKDVFLKLFEEVKQYAGTQRGEAAKMKYEMLKLEQERKRNNYLIYNTILLTIITVVNLVLAFLKCKSD